MKIPFWTKEKRSDYLCLANTPQGKPDARQDEEQDSQIRPDQDRLPDEPGTHKDHKEPGKEHDPVPAKRTAASWRSGRAGFFRAHQ